MDLTYPQEAENFRVEISAWLKDNLPDGWFEPDFSMNEEEKAEFNREMAEEIV